MSYVFGAPKRIEAGGITFLVRTPQGAFSKWQKQAREVLRTGQRLELLQASDENADLSEALAEAEAADQALTDAALGFVVGWEGVVDEEGKPVEFSQERLREIDVYIISQIYTRLGREGAEAQAAVQEGNAISSG